MNEKCRGDYGEQREVPDAGDPDQPSAGHKCRLCLDGFNFSDATFLIDDSLRQMMETVFHFSVVADEALPENVCHRCQSLVSEFYTYSLQVEANQQQLWTHRKERKNEVFEEVKIEPVTEGEIYDIEFAEVPVSVKIESNETSTLADQNTERNADADYRPGEKELADEVDDDGDDDGDDDEDRSVSSGPTGMKLRRHRQRMVKTEKHSRSITAKLKPEGDKSDTEEAAKQEDDQRIQEFYKFECEVCSMKLENLTHLQSHYRREHAIKGYIRCCDKQLFRRFQLLDHMAGHQGTIKCDICHKTYKSSRYLALHMMKSHSREEDRPFKCTKCRQSFHKEHLLKAHQANHLSEKCPICDKIVSSKYALKTHVSHMHGTDGNQICDVCGKEFRTKQAMERHINEHLGVEVVQKVQCHVCQRWFHGKYNLRKHIRFMHIEDGQVFRCDVCQHESPNSRALLDHKKRVHVEEKFACEFCGKRFKRKLYLREHIASHTGKPLYSCDVCSATFNSNANCYNHRKSKHPVEWEARKQAYLDAQMKSPTDDAKREPL
ncbi:transcription factor grauzone-like [Anopheles cruzii]|uniref:transcription factor grauzone-like n=1 Tax=Anopheles cruzii TaxID=68878 RepID=UPI0022EC41E5|nr:transcription factor grauzone-like [Anopheles cruzii]